MDAEPNSGLPSRREPGSTRRRSSSRRRRRPPRRGRPRLRVWMPLLALLFLSPAIYSWVQMARLPSSLPIGVRSVEWLRQHHFNWVIDEAEHYYYSWKAPKKGGPGLTTLPSVGIVGDHPKHAKKTYRPANIKPVFASPLPHEGEWRASGPAVHGGPPVLVTNYRTETTYPQIVAYLAWFDHTRTASAYYPGRYEPPGNVPLRGPSEVPFSQRNRLLATFNSGFIYADGLNGDALNGVTNEPLKQGNATIVAYKNGKVDIVNWTGGTSPGKNVAWARQSLPPIVAHGKRNPALDLSTDWGYTLGNAVRVWRTGLGIDKHGNLIYVAASDQTVISLANILIHAGAVRGMELDINPEWYTLITYRHAHGQLVPTQVAYNPQQPSTRYLVPDDRDFFAIYRRVPGAVTVPLN